MHTDSEIPRQLQLRAKHEIAQYLERIVQHSQFAVTLQTSLRTRNISAKTMQRFTDSARDSLQRFRLQLNRRLTGNGWLRKPQYTPVFIASLEGTRNTYDRHRTLHYHALVGNAPERFDAPALQSLMSDLWKRTDAGTADVVVRPLLAQRAAGWSQYILKEQRAGNWECVDFSNAQLPQHLRGGLGSTL